MSAECREGESKERAGPEGRPGVLAFARGPLEGAVPRETAQRLRSRGPGPSPAGRTVNSRGGSRGRWKLRSGWTRFAASSPRCEQRALAPASRSVKRSGESAAPTPRSWYFPLTDLKVTAKVLESSA